MHQGTQGASGSGQLQQQSSVGGGTVFWGPLGQDTAGHDRASCASAAVHREGTGGQLRGWGQGRARHGDVGMVP